jgi:hypothetical protein
MKPLILVVCLTVAIPCALPYWMTALGAEPVEQKVTPCVIITGADSHVRQRRYLRITSMNDWTQLWMEHKGATRLLQYDLYHDPLTLPLVDFDNYMIIAVFQGDGSNSAGLSVVSMTENTSLITFRFQEKKYQTASSRPSSATPEEAIQAAHKSAVEVKVFGFFVVPRSSKQVRLEENVQGYIGEQPEWQERATFPPVRN